MKDILPFNPTIFPDNGTTKRYFPVCLWELSGKPPTVTSEPADFARQKNAYAAYGKGFRFWIEFADGTGIFGKTRARIDTLIDQHAMFEISDKQMKAMRFANKV